MLIVKYETPTLWAGEEYFELFMRLISFCEAIFDSAILQAPTDGVGSANNNVHIQACL